MTQYTNWDREMLKRLGQIEARLAVLEHNWKIVRAVLLGVAGLLGIQIAF